MLLLASNSPIKTVLSSGNEQEMAEEIEDEKTACSALIPTEADLSIISKNSKCNSDDAMDLDKNPEVEQSKKSLTLVVEIPARVSASKFLG